MKKRRKLKKGVKLFIVILIILAIITCTLIIVTKINNKEIESNITEINYSNYYNQYIVVKEDSILYELNNNEYQEKGIVYSGTVLELEETENTNTEYFKIKDLNSNYYIKYNSVEKCNNYEEKENRYKKYQIA